MSASVKVERFFYAINTNSQFKQNSNPLVGAFARVSGFLFCSDRSLKVEGRMTEKLHRLTIPTRFPFAEVLNSPAEAKQKTTDRKSVV